MDTNFLKSTYGLENSTCVVFGSHGLVGKTCVEYFKKSGASVIEVDLKAKKNEDSKSFALDLTNTKETIDFFKNTLPQQAKTPHWNFINCSYPRTQNWGSLGFENVSTEDFNKNVELHLGSTFTIAKQAVDFLLATQSSGNIVLFGSIYGVVGPTLSIYEDTKMQNPVPYAAIKSGTLGLARYIATAFGSKKIRCNVLSPGGIYDQQPQSFVEAYNKHTSLGRMATPQDIASVATFLCSPAANYITGQNILVDGGWTAL